MPSEYESKYIFISYTERDKDKVYPEIKKIKKMGIDVWYDEGILPVQRYYKTIENKIDNCTLFLAFITPNAIKSDFVCQNEITYASEQKKPILFIYLEPTDLPSGLKIIVAGLQQLHKYKFKEQEYLDRIIKSFNIAKEISIHSDGNNDRLTNRNSIPTRPPSFSRLLKYAYIITGSIISLVILFLCLHHFKILSFYNFDMAHIKSGTFIKGLKEDEIRTIIQSFSLDDSSYLGLSRNKSGEAYLSSFYIDKYEVSNENYKIFVDKTNYPKPSHWLDGNSPFPIDVGKHPVTNVDFKDASAFCAWANKRLPTTQEWEKAARGNDGRLYPWGSKYDKSRCNTVEERKGNTTPVDSYSLGVSPYGIFNLCGNVNEWTSSSIGAHKIVKGGGWKSTCEVYGIAALERLAETDVKRDDLGFRCASDDINYFLKIFF